MTKDKLIAVITDRLTRGINGNKANAQIAAEDIVSYMADLGLLSLNNDAIQQALADHERDRHGVSGPEPIPDDCLADVKARYDGIVLP